MPRPGRLLVAACLAAFALGCASGVREEKIEVKESNDPLSLPRSILQRYAEGQPLGSEATTFPKMVEEVRRVDPVRADLLERGLEDLQQAAPELRPGKAKQLLDQLRPAMK